MKRNIILGVLLLAAIYVGATYSGFVSAQKRVSETREVPDQTLSDKVPSPLNATPQTLPFTQDWSNTGLIATSDDWSGVPGIVGYRGDGLAAATGVDPRTILGEGTPVIDVNANQTSPDTFVTGGVAEFDTLPNPVVALQGSGTARAPSLVLYLNTTGQSNIRVSYNARDIDGSADNAVQPIVTQYRVGNTGNFINVPGGYIADATTGPSLATLVTPVAVTLPAAASNQPEVQVRIMTTDAVGSDEWVGIDDISVTTVATAARSTTVGDFNGDGRTDFSIVRNLTGTASGQLRWYNLFNNASGSYELSWGQGTDVITPGDFDGDGIDDIAIWRTEANGTSGYYIIQSQTFTFRYARFGQENDDPTMVADYDGDGKDDPAIYRAGATPADQSQFWWYGSTGIAAGHDVPVGWGGGPSCSEGGDCPVPGDFNGDGKADFCVYRADDRPGANSANALFLIHPGTGAGDAPGANTVIYFGLFTDEAVPGDYDGDGITDIAVTRREGGLLVWYIRPSSAPSAVVRRQWGSSSGDLQVQGDYDGDGKTDVAVWRFTSSPAFYALGSANSTVIVQPIGVPGASDNPAVYFVDVH